MSTDDSSPSALTLDELQARVDDWITQWDEGYWSPLSNLARLTEEVGELGRLLNRRHGDKKPKSNDDPPDERDLDPVAEELGDILFVVVVIANALDVDLEQALAGVLTKYDVRDAGRWTRSGED